MKILHINDYNSKGGAETVFNITRNNLKDFDNFSGFNVRNKNKEVPDLKFTSWENDKKFLGIINYIFSISNYKRLSEFLDKNKMDVIHIHGFFSSISPSLLLVIKKIKKKQNVKVIQTLHDYHAICPNSSLYNYSKHEVCEQCIGKKFKLRIFLNNCDRRGWTFSIIKGIRSFVANNILKHRDVIDLFIAPSMFLRDKILKDNFDHTKVILLRYPIVYNQHNLLTEKENIICYFGRFSEEKNIKFLIEAFIQWKNKRPNDFRLLIIGEGEKETELKTFAEQSKFNKEINFKNFLPPSELQNAIRVAKYSGITSSWYENFPMSIIESIMLNIVPIAPDIGGMEEMITDFFKIGRVYKSGEITSWISAIENLEKYYSEEMEKLLKAKNDILSNYGIDSYTKELHKIYLGESSNKF
jgi:glycosyltransferase involved in cell wall biosynthesis